MSIHYDIRVICPVTGQLEATEDIGLEEGHADRIVAEIMPGTTTRYAVVACDRPGDDEVHDVDLAYHRHVREHLGHKAEEMVRWVGQPQADWIKP